MVINHLLNGMILQVGVAGSTYDLPTKNHLTGGPESFRLRVDRVQDRIFRVFF